MLFKQKLIAMAMVSITAQQAIQAAPSSHLASDASNDLNSPAFLSGFDSISKRYVETCLRPGKITHIPDGITILNFTKYSSYSELLKSLNIDIDASASSGLYSGSLNAEFAKDVKEDNYSMSFIYHENIQLDSEVYGLPDDWKGGNDALSPNYKIAYDTDPVTFRTACGDSFVNKWSPGANLYVALKVNFNSSAEKESFAAGLKGSTSIAEISTSIKTAMSSKQLNGSINFYAYQFGGDTENLTQILQTESGDVPVLHCSLENMDPCTDAIEAVINYTNAPNGFAAQMKPDAEGNPPKRAAVLASEQIKYDTTAFIHPKHEDTPPGVAEARQKLADAYTKMQDQEQKIEHFRNLSMDMQQQSKDILKNMQTDTEANETTLADIASNYCYAKESPDDLAECAAQVDAGISHLKPVDMSSLNEWNLKTGGLKCKASPGQQGVLPITFLGGNYTMVTVPINGGTDVLIKKINGPQSIPAFDNNFSKEVSIDRTTMHGVFKHSTGYYATIDASSNDGGLNYAGTFQYSNCSGTTQLVLKN